MIPTMETTEALRRTPLDQNHRRAGAKMVPFAGWEMPLQYRGVIPEHHAVRQAAGLFDVSHMGEILVEGPGALAYLQSLTPNDVAQLDAGRAHYSGLLTEDGTYVDDILIYCRGEERYLVVVNAANVAVDFAWMKQHAPAGVRVEDASEQWALMALQGPRAAEILASLVDVDLATIKNYRFAEGRIGETAGIISRTGYTGEDGFELYVPPAAAPAIWEELLRLGAPLGLEPAGLGCRDTLRLEAGMALYGHEIDRETTPLEAGLSWVVKLGKEADFLGRAALEGQQQAGLGKRLVGLEVLGRGIAREGHEVFVGDERVGVVRSGTMSPTLGKAIATAHVSPAASELGTAVEIDVRGRRVEAQVVALPFYRRPR
jgi:aminomethyltransferase